MSRIKAAKTKPENIVAALLRKLGIKYRRNVRSLPGSPDFRLVQARKVIFVNGCFWHRCPYCKPSVPKTHKAFWSKKFAANVARDKRKRAELKKLGIKSVVFWECQIKKNAPKLVARLRKVLSSRKKVSARPAV